MKKTLTKKEKALFCIEKLKEEFPDPACCLTHKTPLELLIAVRLSAQCTDERVNKITPALFEKFPTLDSFADAEVSDIEFCVHSCGFGNTKAKDIKMMCRKLREEFGGELPDTMEGLTSLPGVGRKTANLILGDVFGKPAVVTDTHVIRISNLLGLCDTKDPRKVEDILRGILPEQESGNFCHRMVFHGRKTCIARRPKCEGCVLNEVCSFYNDK